MKRSNRIIVTKYPAQLIENDFYYHIPKFLFKKDYNKLPNNAKILYAILLDKLKTGYVDEEENVYLILTRDEMCNILNMGRNTVTKLMQDLVEYDLIEDIQMGLGIPNRIYVKGE
ncbi:MAG: replication initiator protein A [Bacilli bacterium]|nr:replication initiator protein A [Bacilli bacterium]